MRDTAKLHVAALLKEDLANTRVFGFAEPWNRHDIYQIVKALRPDRKLAEEPAPNGRDISVVAERPLSVELLKWLGQDGGFISLRDSVLATIEAYEESQKAQ